MGVVIIGVGMVVVVICMLDMHWVDGIIVHFVYLDQNFRVLDDPVHILVLVHALVVLYRVLVVDTVVLEED